MRPTRKTQPFRKGPRHLSQALDAARKGAPAFFPNAGSLRSSALSRAMTGSRRQRSRRARAGAYPR